MSNPIMFASIFAFLAVFFGAYGLFAPRKEIKTSSSGSEFFANEDIEGVDVQGTPFDRYVRPMLRNFLPQSPLSSSLSASENDKITELLVRSGNPWNIRPEEYKGTQFLFAVIGFFFGILLAAFNLIPVIPWFMVMILPAVMGYAIPFSVHNTARENRAKEVQKQLPEALDLLVVSMSAGQNFEPALSQITPKMPDGLLKEEFTRISKELNAGRTLNQTLTSFAKRAASDDSESFAKSVLQAQRLGSDVTDTLKTQARAARSNYEARLEKKIASLSQRMFIFLIPTMLPALLIIFMVPPLQQLVGSGIL